MEPILGKTVIFKSSKKLHSGIDNAQPGPEQSVAATTKPTNVALTKKRRTPCPRGSRRNPKTGECETYLKAVRADAAPAVPLVPSRVQVAADAESTVQEAPPLEKPAKTIKIKRAPVAAKKLILDNVLSDIPKNSNEYLRDKEKVEYDTREQHQDRPFLYPDLDDPSFSAKIAKRKEFHDSQYDGAILGIEEHANKMCAAEFELMPHQIFVKNFLSLQTPYNSLLLYHGLGSGKTCSAIGIAEEMRAYMKQVGIRQRIIVVAAPNVQANFRMQLFDERRLREVDGAWTIQSCIGDTLIREINPTNLKGLSRERVISQIKTIINQYYVFMGYIELANFIQKKTSVPEDTGYSQEEQRRAEIRNIRRFFNNRLIIIDEVHNIRLTNENKDWKTAQSLTRLTKYCDNLRLLMLSATPMYNSHKEIIWLVNLMNSNDRRGTITAEEVFDKDGNFREPKMAKDGTVLVEGGRELLHRKLIGYVSYIRGENPYTFPYRIYPTEFAPEQTFQDPATVMGSLAKVAQTLAGQRFPKAFKTPKVQLNGRPIEDPMEHVPLYLTQVGEYQETAYRVVIDAMRTEESLSETLTFEELDRFGFRRLQTPLEALNIVYPSPILDAYLAKGEVGSLSTSTTASSPSEEEAQKDATVKQRPLSFTEEEEEDDEEEEDHEGEQSPISSMVGKRGMKTVMTYIDDSKKNIPMKYGFDYRPEILERYGRIFSPPVLPQYSAKIARICEIIRKSTGIVMIYSQYIDGGIVPLALALEEMGFGRYGSAEYTRPLFAKPPTEPLDAMTMKPRSTLSGDEVAAFKPAKYVMITGDKSYSPQNAAEIKHVTGPNNRMGELVKVIMISKAGSEGLDFKNIRQIHILEPWYNLNRIEQIIGRGVRNLSHCALEFSKRNVEIYMHGSMLPSTPDEEAADIYVYRLAKRKAEQIGQVTRLIKETAVDCLLNIGQTNFTVDKMASIAANQAIHLELSTDKKRIQFRVGDRPHTDICDYMDTCDMKCFPAASTPSKAQLIQDTYSTNFVQMNNPRIMQRVRQLFRDERKGQHFFKFSELVEQINVIKQYPIEQIYSALNAFITNKNEFLVDKQGRRGNLINRGNIYAFQPVEISDEAITVFERSAPVDVKRTMLDMEIPKVFPEDGSNGLGDEKGRVKESGSGATTKDGSSDQPTAYELIKTTFEENLKHATTEYKGSLSRDHDWYKHASLVVNHLQMVHSIGLGEIIDHIIHHMVDVLLPHEKLVVISHIYSKIREAGSLSELEEAVKAYLDTKMVHVGSRTGIVIAEKTTWKLYTQSSEDPASWTEAEPEDIRLFERSGEMAKFRVDPDLYSTSVGFINMFKTGKEMVFRIKNVEQMQNNTGTNIDSYGKKYIIKRLNEVLDANMYTPEKSKHIYQPGFSVIMEIIMRQRTATRFEAKVWFLDPEQAMYSEIAKYQRSKE